MLVAEKPSLRKAEAILDQFIDLDIFEEAKIINRGIIVVGFRINYENTYKFNSDWRKRIFFPHKDFRSSDFPGFPSYILQAVWGTDWASFLGEKSVQRANVLT